MKNSSGQVNIQSCPVTNISNRIENYPDLHLILPDIGEGNGNPLQCPCLENPMDGGAWWATVHGVAKSRTQLSDFTFTG